jgi:hypothetical protein
MVEIDHQRLPGRHPEPDLQDVPKTVETPMSQRMSADLRHAIPTE